MSQRPRPSRWFEKVAAAKNKRQVSQLKRLPAEDVKAEGATDNTVAPAPAVPPPKKRRTAGPPQPRPEPRTTATAGAAAARPPPADAGATPSTPLAPDLEAALRVAMGVEVALSLADKLQTSPTLDYLRPIVCKFSGHTLTVASLLRALALSDGGLQLRVLQRRSEARGLTTDVLGLLPNLGPRSSPQLRARWFAADALHRRSAAARARLAVAAAAASPPPGAGPTADAPAPAPAAAGRWLEAEVLALWQALPPEVQGALRSGEYGPFDLADTATSSGPPAEPEELLELADAADSTLMPAMPRSLTDFHTQWLAAAPPLQLAHTRVLPAREPLYGDVAALGLCDEVRRHLEHKGVPQLYRHQVQAIQHVLQGRHAIVTTGTSSGKSLCYLVPALQALAQFEARPPAPPGSAEEWLPPHFLYLSPTKALAQDQLGAVRGFAPAKWHALFQTYDGDVAFAARGGIREAAAFLLTNPDMVHCNILPHHAQWSDWLASLRYVVLDEAHMYRGAFGAHVAAVLRRLRRLCAFHRAAHPATAAPPLQFIACSATLADPAEHFQHLTAAEACVVDDDTSPSGGRYIVLWNPPPEVGCTPAVPANVPDPAAGTAEGHSPAAPDANLPRTSPYREAARLAANLMLSQLRTLVFVKARQTAELVLNYLHRLLRDTGHADLVELAKCYRGGYQAPDRRRVEQELFCGQLRAVVATTALEVGVDVGSLDAVIMVGYPGTKAGLWQQMGRAGRGRRPGLAVLVPLPGPLDQYLIRHPDVLLGCQAEHTVVDPGNPVVLRQHLLCAAAEQPLTEAEHATGPARWGDAYAEVVAELLAAGALRWGPGGGGGPQLGPGDGGGRRRPGPHAAVSLRNVARDVYRVVRQDTGETLEEITGPLALLTVYDGATYMFHGQHFIVSSLCLKTKISHVLPAKASHYYTTVQDVNEVHFVGCVASNPLQRQELPEAYAIPLNLTTPPPVDIPAAASSSAAPPPTTIPALPAVCAAGGLEDPDDSLPPHTPEHAPLLPKADDPTSPPAMQPPRPSLTTAVGTALAGAPLAAPCLHYGSLRIRRRIFGYHKCWTHTGQIFDTCPLSYPPQEYGTSGFWLDVPTPIRDAVLRRGRNFYSGLHAVLHTALQLLPLYVAADLWDISGVTVDRHPQRRGAVLCIFDQVEGGMGMTSRAFQYGSSILQDCYRCIASCGCTGGCLHCIYSPKCDCYNEGLDKVAALMILRDLLFY